MYTLLRLGVAGNETMTLALTLAQMRTLDLTLAQTKTMIKYKIKMTLAGYVSPVYDDPPEPAYSLGR